MTLSGGPADKFGNSYEGRWTVRCMIEILEERAGSIRLEPPGSEGEGVEFWLSCGTDRQWHQVKRQHGGEGRWNISDLKARGVLGHFRRRLEEAPTDTCWFVSAHAAHQLDELAQGATKAASFTEFDREFVGRAKWVVDSFGQLRDAWLPWSAEETYHALARVHVVTQDERSLLNGIIALLTRLVEGEPANALDILAQFALDSVYKELDPLDLWRHLAERGYRRRHWENDPTILATVEAANDRYLDGLNAALSAIDAIPRDEATRATDLLTRTNGKKGVLLTGGAGVGKSEVVRETVVALRERGLPVLAFRIDRLDPVQLSRDIGKKIGLPGSPVAVLAAIAQGRDCVLVLDQVDAVSRASGRHPEFFDAVYALLHEAEVYPRMRLLLSCRAFDAENDPRLRALSSGGLTGTIESVSVEALPHTTVQQVVRRLGLDDSRLTERQLNLLAIPLHLCLLAQVASETEARALDFETEKDLLDLYWQRKQQLIRERLGTSVPWVDILDRLATHMSESQRLSAPIALLDEWEAGVGALVSEHVLVRDGHEVAFFHESFFDYVFARRFLARGGDLIGLLRSGEQPLFRRAQVRQILLHERDIRGREQYLSDLRGLLHQPEIRFHIKQVVLALLADLEDPTEPEWDALAALLNEDGPLGRQVWGVIEQPRWARLSDQLGLVQRWLASEDERQVDRTILLLARLSGQMSERVDELVAPYAGVQGRWRDRLLALVRWMHPDLGVGRWGFELALRVSEDATRSEGAEASELRAWFWEIVRRLSGTHSDLACQAVGRYLLDSLELGLIVRAGAGRSVRDALDNLSGTGMDAGLRAGARGAPEAFVAHVLPVMLRLIEANAWPIDGPPWRDGIWQYRTFGFSVGLSDALLAAAEIALEGIMRDGADDAAAAALAPLRERADEHETVQYLLMRAYTAAGARFADEAADFLCEDGGREKRLEVGYINDPSWATRQLLSAITLHCSVAALARLEEVLLKFHASWELGTDNRARFGAMQWALLPTLAPSRRSRAVTARIQELERKLGPRPEAPPPPFMGGPVGSPVPATAADKMTDAQWLEAMATYARDDMRARGGGIFSGGAYELAALLETQAKAQPQRFADLLWRLPDTTHPAYFEAVLRALTQADPAPSTEDVLRACQRCHALPGRPLGRWITGPITRVAYKPLPKEALDLVAWYATEDPDPTPDREPPRIIHPSMAGGGEDNRRSEERGQELVILGLNSARGVAAQALGELVFADGTRLPHLLAAIEHIARDPSSAVRACGATSLIGVLRHDRALAVHLFLLLCDTEERLAATSYGERFLSYATQTHFKELQPILTRMLASDVEEIVAVGARQACLAALNVPEARQLADLCLVGSEAQRLGVAVICAANLGVASARTYCREALRQLFADPSPRVRAAAAACFRNFAGSELGDFVDLVEVFVSSAAFADHAQEVLDAMRATTAKLPLLTLLVCEQFLNVAGDEVADISTRAAALAIETGDLLVRAYSQSTDSVLRSRCLDAVDRMAERGAYGIREALELHDR